MVLTFKAFILFHKHGLAWYLFGRLRYLVSKKLGQKEASMSSEVARKEAYHVDLHSPPQAHFKSPS